MMIVLSLYEKVHSGGAFQAAKDWYESGLWPMLYAPRPEHATFSGFMEKTIQKNGWYRAPADPLKIGRLIFEEREPAYNELKGPAYQTALQYFITARSLDDVAMLAALFREAHEDLDIRLSLRLRDSLEVAQDEYCRRLNLAPVVRTLLDRLILDRIVGNRWISENDIPKMALEEAKTRKARLQAFVRWYVQSGSHAPASSRARHPIVLSAPQLRWLETRREDITYMVEYLRYSHRYGAFSTDYFEREMASHTEVIRSQYAHEIQSDEASEQLLPKVPLIDVPADMKEHRKQRAKRANKLDRSPLPRAELRMPSTVDLDD